MDSQPSAHDLSVEAGKKLKEAEDKLKQAEGLLFEANLRMKKVRDFEATLLTRKRKLDRAFVALNKQKQMLQEREMKSLERETFLHDNLNQF